MTITPRFRVAAAVAGVRQIDAKNGTDTAISDVATLMHLSPETVAEIAREEAHAEALIEDQRRSIAAVAASSLGITVELADRQCRGCGACKRTKAPVEA
jgi:hypothetical protein